MQPPVAAEPHHDQWRRMMAGELYRASDPYLTSLRTCARTLTRAFNDSPDGDLAARRAILADLLGRVGESIEVEPPFRCDYGKNIRIGERFFANFGLVILDCSPVDIGDDVFIAPGVHIYAATHPTDAQTRCSGLEFGKPVRIRSRVWIGGAAIILPGVTIGDEAVIGAGSVVTRDVPPGALVAGNPALVLRHLTPPPHAR